MTLSYNIIDHNFTKYGATNEVASGIFESNGNDIIEKTREIKEEYMNELKLYKYTRAYDDYIVNVKVEVTF